MVSPFDTAWKSLRKATLGVSKPQGWEKLDRRYKNPPGKMRSARKKRLDDFQGRVNDTPLDRGEHDIMDPTVLDRYDDTDIEWGEVYDETGYPTGEIDYGSPESLRALNNLRYFREQHPTRSPGTANDFGKYPFWIGRGTHPDGGEMSFNEEGEPNKWTFSVNANSPMFDKRRMEEHEFKALPEEEQDRHDLGRLIHAPPPWRDKKQPFDGVHSGQPRRLGHYANRVDEE